MAELSSKHWHSWKYQTPANIRNGITSVQKYMFLIKKQYYMSNNFQFHLFSAKIISKQREPLKIFPPKPQKISASAARLLGCFSMSGTNQQANKKSRGTNKKQEQDEQTRLHARR